MIIEDLIRTGRLLKEGGLRPEQLLLLISDADSPQVKNFFQHVFVVELPPNDADEKPIALPKQVWGQEVQPDPKKKKVDFLPDLKKAISAPFVFPGGNPIHPQGIYGVPVFPVFEKHLESFKQGADRVRDFLSGRLARCPSLDLDDTTVEAMAKSIYEEVIKSDPSSQGKTLCLMVLANANCKDSPYQYVDRQTEVMIGESRLRPGKHIAPNFERIASLYSSCKYEEGRQSGSRGGSCSICGQATEEEVVSIYCKSWPWFLPTWTCPVAHGGKAKVAEGIALDRACYEALNIGASYFDKIASPVDSIITRELFSPVADREGRRTAEHRSLGDLPTIFGAILMLPILDAEQIEDDQRVEFGENLRVRLKASPDASRMQKYINRVVGFDASLPDAADDSLYRLTLIYYSGDPSRGDVHLRCVVEDVVPTVLYQLLQISQETAAGVPDLCVDVLPGSSEKQQAWHAKRFQFVPFILARAYGSAYVWEQMQAILRREPLHVQRPTANIAHRISSLVTKLPKTEYDVREEILFYLTFLSFVQAYNNTLAQGDGPAMAMRDWKSMLTMVAESPPEEMEFESSNELGFTCGVLVRQFSRQYWSVTKVGKDGKDFLKHRILAFGSDLSPDTVWKKALPAMFNVELKLDKLYLSDEFRRRVGILLNRCEDAQDDIRANRDGFMAAFWSGYALQKTDKAKLENQPEEQGATA